MAIASLRHDDTDHLADVRAAFALACAARPAEVREWFVRITGRRVRLRIAGGELGDQLSRCFATLTELTDAAGRDAAAELTIEAWDRAATRVGCPGIRYAADTTDELGSGLLSQYREGRVLRYDRAAMIKCFDRAERALFVCVHDARRNGLSERSKPFPHFLATWCHDRGVEVLHAGLVARAGRGILLGGGSGSGKSTSAIAAALGGFDFLGDDCVGTEITATACRGHACYDAVRVDAGSLARFPLLRTHQWAPDGPRDRGKSMVYMSDVVGRRAAADTTIVAIVLPRIVGAGPSRLVPVTKGTALRKLAPSTLLRGLGSRAEGMGHIAELVRRLPCFELELGATVDDVPGELDGYLASLDS
jgi:hypothetical protein